MGWSMGFDSDWNRDIGYEVPAICDSPKCNKRIDRGLSYVCSGQPYGGETGCGLYFCSEHLYFHTMRANPEEGPFCIRCIRHQKSYKPKPEMRRWLRWKLNHSSWEEWRLENSEEVKRYKELLNKGQTNE